MEAERIREKTGGGKVAGDRKGLFRPGGFENLPKIGEYEIPGQIDCHPACDKDAYGCQVAAFGDLPLLSRFTLPFSGWQFSFFLGCRRQFAALSVLAVLKKVP